jgi:hypothetical protein
MSEETLNHVRFDRHKIFNQDDLEMVMTLINDCRMLRHYNGGTTFNQLFGLCDGYLYNDLLTNAKEVLMEVNYGKLEKLVRKIENHR